MEGQGGESVHDHVHDDTSAVAATHLDEPFSRLRPKQALFEKTVSEKLNVPYKYAKVTVLLIHWVKYLDSGSDCDEEVKGLKRVFETRFNFEAEVLEVNNQKHPQLQLDHRIMKFILDHDGPCETTLMIVYYTGHGFGPADGLYISGRREPGLQSLGNCEPKACWNKAQQYFWNSASADVLVILDTCFAGSAMKGTMEDARSFEVLAATSNDLPTAAGVKSFSKALIGALEDYADEPLSAPFTAFELNRRIQEKRGDQHSQVLPLRGASRKFIKLAPLSGSDTAIVPRVPLKASSNVMVRLTLEEIKTLEDKHVIKLATVLSKAATKSSMGINSIALVDYEESEYDKTTTDAMKIWKLLPLIRSWMRRTKRAKQAKEENSLEEKSQPELIFQSMMCHEFQIPERYTEVGVLLVKWADELDEIGVKGEVAELEELFGKDNYNYKTTLLELNIASRPQAQLNAAVANFVRDHEGTNRRNLLIIYYSGHAMGVQDEHELIICGATPATPPFGRSESSHEAVASWTRAESDLQDANADVLAILDCCFAGNIVTTGFDEDTRGDKALTADGFGRDPRCFEVLTAVGRSELARSPGPKSYSRCLIDILKEELGNPTRGTLNTFDLNEAITRRSQRFSSGLFNRYGQRTGRHISLAPLASEKDRRPYISETTKRTAILDLKLVFDTDCILDPKDTEILAAKLARAAKQADEGGRMGIRSIEWVGYRASVSAIESKLHRTSYLKKRYGARWWSIVKRNIRKRKADERFEEEDNRSKRLRRDGEDLPTPPPSALDNTPSPRP